MLQLRFDAASTLLQACLKLEATPLQRRFEIASTVRQARVDVLTLCETVSETDLFDGRTESDTQR